MRQFYEERYFQAVKPLMFSAVVGFAAGCLAGWGFSRNIGFTLLGGIGMAAVCVVSTALVSDLVTKWKR